jgi:hypothetical protein
MSPPSKANPRAVRAKDKPEEQVEAAPEAAPAVGPEAPETAPAASEVNKAAAQTQTPAAPVTANAESEQSQRSPEQPAAAGPPLRATRTADLFNEVRNQRLLIEARALSDIGRHDLTLEIVANLESQEAVRQRSDVLWAARRWQRSAEQFELLYGDRWKTFEPLSDVERIDILRAGIGYALGNDAIGISRLKEKYAAKMAEGSDRRSFEVIIGGYGTKTPNSETCTHGGIGRHVGKLSARHANALSGNKHVTVVRDPATGAAVVRRTQAASGPVLKSFLIDGPASSPSPVRGSRRPFCPARRFRHCRSSVRRWSDWAVAPRA